MNKRTVKTTMVVLMLLVVALYFVSGTYARYASEFSGTASAQIAKWAVKLGSSSSSNLTFTVQNSSDVVATKIAPSVKATAKAELNLEGTEVSVDVIVEKDDQFDTKINELGFTEDQIKFSVAQSSDTNVTVEANGEGTEEKPFVIKLKNGAAFSAEDKLGFDLTIEWENNDANNANDTTVGTTGGTLELPVKLTVQQHIDA